MKFLRLSRQEDDILVFTDDYGNEYRVNAQELDDVDLSPKPSRTGLLSPKEIQSRIRSGESVESVIKASGADPEVIERYAGPILDELDFVLETALGIRIIAIREDDDTPDTFGEILEQRVRDRHPDAQPHWLSWKDLISGNWIIQLIVDDQENPQDGRWFFDLKRKHLSPANEFAEFLSTAPEENRDPRDAFFTQTAAVTEFPLRDQADEKKKIAAQDTMPHNEPVEYGRTDGAIITQLYQSTPEPDHPAGAHQSDELLEVLRKNRGQRQAAFYPDSEDDSESAETARVTNMRYRTEDIDLPLETADFTEQLPSDNETLDIDFEVNLDSSETIPSAGEEESPTLFSSGVELREGDSEASTDFEDLNQGTETPAEHSQDQLPSSENPEGTGAEEQAETKPAPRSRKGRQAVPSWDEIIFGTKTD